MASLDRDLQYHGTTDFVMILVLSFLLLFFGKFGCLQLPVTRKALGVSMGLDVSIAALLSSMRGLGLLLLPVSLGFFLHYLLSFARLSGQKKNVLSVKRTIAVGLAFLAFLVLGMVKDAFVYSSSGSSGLFFLSASVWALLGFLVSFLWTLSDLLRWLKGQRANADSGQADDQPSL